MKKILIVTFYFILSNCLQAQTKELSFSYSPLSIYRVGHTDEEGFDESSHFVLGAFNFDYYNYLNNWLKLGANLMYDREAEKGVYTGMWNRNVPYEITNSIFVIAPQVDFEYLRNPSFRLSSGLSVGYTIVNGSISDDRVVTEGMKNGFIFHVNLISFRWGKKRGLCGYMGLGHKGFLGLGYFVRI